MSHTEPNQPPVVQNKAPSPPGVIPRNAQAWVLGGLAAVMMLVIAFSGSNAPPTKRSPAAPPVAPTDPNEGRIKEYRERIEAGAKKLNEVKDQLEKERAAEAVAALPEASGAPYARSNGYDRVDTSRLSVYAPAPEKSWIEQDREKRDYLSLYASNIALSHRQAEQTSATRELPLGPDRAVEGVFAKSRRAHDADETEDDARASERADEKKGREEIDQAAGPKYRLFEGTFMETVLTNRLDGSFSGPVNCMTTADLFSHNGQHVLIPAGSRILGEVKRVDAFGQERLAVVFHRLIMPDGYTMSLDKFRGLNQVGETGLRDQINHHYLQVFGVSIAIGAIAGLSQANTSSGIGLSAADAYRQGVSASLSQSSLRILDRYLNVLPTITIREGQRVKIYLADDLLLPAYENHRMPNEL